MSYLFLEHVCEELPVLLKFEVWVLLKSQDHIFPQLVNCLQKKEWFEHRPPMMIRKNSYLDEILDMRGKVLVCRLGFLATIVATARTVAR